MRRRRDGGMEGGGEEVEKWRGGGEKGWREGWREEGRRDGGTEGWRGRRGPREKEGG